MTHKSEHREQIYQEYINSEASLMQLAEKWDVPYGRIEQWSASEGWPEKRKKIKQEVRRQAEAQALKKRVETLVRWNEGDIRLAMAIRQQIADILQGAAEAKRNGDLKAAYIHPDNLRTMTAVIEGTQRIVRTALGAIDGNKVQGEHEHEDGEDDVIEAIEVRVKSGRLRPLPGSEPSAEEA